MAESPLSAFLGGQERALGLRRQRFDLQQAQQAAPQLAAQRDIALQRQQLGLQSDIGQQRLKGAQLLQQVVKRVKQVPDPNQRLQIFERARPELQQFGVALPENLSLENVTDQGLVPLETGLGQSVQQLTAGQQEFRDLTQDLSPEDLQRARRIRLRLDPGAVGSAAQTISAEGTAERVAGTEQTLSRGRQRGKESAQIEATSIAEGRDAARGIPVLRRTIGLLDEINTGGFNAALIRARQQFGIEGADEGELSANLGQAVLGDLRATFGAAFTEREGERLERIRANLGRSTVANRRLVSQALQIAEDAANRAIDDAIESVLRSPSD